MENQWKAGARASLRSFKHPFKVLSLAAAIAPIATQAEEPPAVQVTILQFAGATSPDNSSFFEVYHRSIKDGLTYIIQRVEPSHTELDYIRQLSLWPNNANDTWPDRLKNANEDLDYIKSSHSLLLLRGSISTRAQKPDCCLSPSYSPAQPLREVYANAIGPIPESGDLKMATDAFQIVVLLSLAADAKRANQPKNVISLFISELNERVGEIRKSNHTDKLIDSWLGEVQKVAARIVEDYHASK